VKARSVFHIEKGRESKVVRNEKRAATLIILRKNPTNTIARILGKQRIISADSSAWTHFWFKLCCV
jgi:hypothetical protein